jgi:regulator of ribonuclease activity A
MSFSTASLCDRYPGLQIADPLLRNFGGITQYYGVISTLKCFEDNSKIREILTSPGDGKVLVVDGGGSHRCALVDCNLAELARNNGWQGLVVYGCVRDVDALKALPLGILALHAHPMLCHQRDSGEPDGIVTFAGINFRKNHFLYADADGIVVSDQCLS